MNHIDRKKDIAFGAIPPKGTKQYAIVTEYLEKKKSSNSDEFSKKNWEKVNLSLEAQYQSNCGFITEKNLRHFLLEFNSRAWESGLWSMPTLFNVMESFLGIKNRKFILNLLKKKTTIYHS